MRTRLSLGYAVLFVRRFRRPTHMQVAQIAKGCFIFVAHSAREIRIVQVLITRRLRHVLQHIEPASNRSLPVRRKLLPFRQDVVLDVISLLRRKFLPRLRTVAHLLLLLGRKPVELLLVPLSLLRC